MLTQAQLKEYLHYDPETGVFTWLKTTSNRVKVGNIAGHNENGYCNISLLNKSYKAHKLAWLYMTGILLPSTTDIDHRNNNRFDNRWCNLRKATRSQNLLNQLKRPGNTSGYKNVWFNKQRNRWQADCVIGGKYYYFGQFKDPKAASEAYEAFAKVHHGDFYKEPA